MRKSTWENMETPDCILAWLRLAQSFRVRPMVSVGFSMHSACKRDCELAAADWSPHILYGLA